ncbi:MAG TPA: helix-turn-helix domain-containing protein [Gammaproteobacteria bacterium]
MFTFTMEDICPSGALFGGALFSCLLCPLSYTLKALTFVFMNITSRKADYALPLPVRRALRKLGQDVRQARLRRRLPAAVVAERASISRTTLFKLEKGEPGVSIGIVATVLFVLGLGERLSELADVRHDEHGLALEEERLPQRIRRRRRTPAETA